MSNDVQISPDLLEILRDPLAVQDKEKYGDDPGKLELVHNCWLVSNDTGLKYPIKEGIPVMLIDEGMKWKDTPIEDLPIPPPPLVPESPSSAAAPSAAGQVDYSSGDGLHPLIYVAAAVGIFVILFALWKLLFGRR
ncbi:hypothetical protein QUF58_09810 [Anaerolineales bacterium HSG24]|nr:hypothetical protein [Anaerolineales bacterium HSG24]